LVIWSFLYGFLDIVIPVSEFADYQSFTRLPKKTVFYTVAIYLIGVNISVVHWDLSILNKLSKTFVKNKDLAAALSGPTLVEDNPHRSHHHSRYRSNHTLLPHRDEQWGLNRHNPNLSNQQIVSGWLIASSHALVCINKSITIIILASLLGLDVVDDVVTIVINIITGFGDRSYCSHANTAPSVVCIAGFNAHLTGTHRTFAGSGLTCQAFLWKASENGRPLVGAVFPYTLKVVIGRNDREGAVIVH
jgi:hypothetical protein